MALLRLRGWPAPANPWNDSLTVFDTGTEFYATSDIDPEYAADPTAVEVLYGKLEGDLPIMLKERVDRARLKADAERASRYP